MVFQFASVVLARHWRKQTSRTAPVHWPLPMHRSVPLLSVIHSFWRRRIPRRGPELLGSSLVVHSPFGALCIAQTHHVGLVALKHGRDGRSGGSSRAAKTRYAADMDSLCRAGCRPGTSNARVRLRAMRTGFGMARAPRACRSKRWRCRRAGEAIRTPGPAGSNHVGRCAARLRRFAESAGRLPVFRLLRLIHH